MVQPGMRGSGGAKSGMVLRAEPGAELAVLAGGGPGASAVVSSSTDSATVSKVPGENHSVSPGSPE